MAFFKSIFKGKANAHKHPPQGSESAEQREILEEPTDIELTESEEPIDTGITESEERSDVQITEDSINIEMKDLGITDKRTEDELLCKETFSEVPMWTEQNSDAIFIPEYNPVVSLSSSPEACQIRTLMKGFDSDVRARYEAKCNADPHAGSILVELLEQYKVFEESALISHGQQQNMSHLVEYIRNCIEGYISSKRDDVEGEAFEKLIKKVIKCLQTLGDIARCYAEPGWVYRLAIDSSLTERMSRVTHEIKVSFQRLGCMENNEGPKLENMHRFLVDTLKSCGNGSWSAGLIALGENSDTLQSLATSLATSQNSLIVETHLNMNLPWALKTLSAKGARKDECRTAFQEYCDTAGNDGSNNLLSTIGFEKYWTDSCESTDMTKCIQEASKIFVKLDSDFDGLLTLNDFETIYLQKGVSAAKSLIRRICGVSAEKKMRHTFDSFAMFGMGGHNGESKVLSLDSARFAKLCRDSNMISKPNHIKELDIVFSKCVPHNCKRMDFEHFLASISRMSVAIDMSVSEICKRIMTSAGPTSRCTKSSFIKLHDDRSLFTGIYARGGPDVGPVTVDMKAFVGRVRPKEKATFPDTLEVTLPESPTMATTSRITTPGSRTPGRGASLEACEMRKSREMMNSTGSKGKKGKKPGSSVAFGRASEQKETKNVSSTDRSMQKKSNVSKQQRQNSVKCIDISAIVDVRSD